MVEKNEMLKIVTPMMEHAIKAPLVMTGSAIDPAYLFTCLCPDPKCRKPPARKKVQHEA